jgi:hypothetical protein
LSSHQIHIAAASAVFSLRFVEATGVQPLIEMYLRTWVLDGCRRGPFGH